MDKQQAIRKIQETFQNVFNAGRFTDFVGNLLNHVEYTPNTVYRGNLVPDAFKPYISSLKRIGKYRDADGKMIDVLIVDLRKKTSLERARTMQRNFVAWYLNGSRGGVLKDAAIVAFVSPDKEDWRFSFVKMEYRFTETPKGNIKVKEEFTPAKRYSFLVGRNEDSHTAQSRLVPLLIDDERVPSLNELEETFSIEKVTKEFFEKYRDLFLRTKEALDEIVDTDNKIKNDFASRGVSTADFSKKLLGQIVFLYFLQKKGWFGVKRGNEWGTGSKHFLRELFRKKHGDYQNFFNDILEPLFYNTLAVERQSDYSDRFDCKIPFLNGGLFDPLNDYDWVDTDIKLPDDLFSNKVKTKEDIGTGILDVFDRYNFTVKEDEPLEKEVAVDPEMLGKVFENLLEVTDRKSKGTYYTPREIVHYMCQESLINYLVTECNITSPPHPNPLPQGERELTGESHLSPPPSTGGGKGEGVIISRDDIEKLIKYGETAVEHDRRVVNEGRETKDYSFKLPESIRRNAALIDEKLADIRVCDPAIGSGAFPVGMMNEIVRTRNALSTYLSTPAISSPTLKKGGEGGFSERTPYNFKRHAIHDCLYGVDIDPGAVEIAKLRLWLSLMVEEEDIKVIKPLPNLDYKIMQGNSLLEEYEGIKLFDEKLISSKPFDEEQIREIKEKRLQLQKELIELHNTGKLTKAKRQELETEQNKLVGILKKINNPRKDADQASIAYEVGASDIAKRLKQLHESYFDTYHKRRKDELRNEIDALEWELIEATLKEQGLEDALLRLAEIKRANVKPFFLWKLNFNEVFNPPRSSSSWQGGEAEGRGGFDIVIANPPYVRQEAIKDLKPSLSKEFGKFYCGTADIYTYFYKRGIDVLKPGGHLCFIAPNKFMRAGYGKNTRELLTGEVTPKAVIDFCDLPIFDATTYPAIVLVENTSSQCNVQTQNIANVQTQNIANVQTQNIANVQTQNIANVQTQNIASLQYEFLAATFANAEQLNNLGKTLSEIRFPMPVKHLRPEGWNLERPEVLALMEKLRSTGVPLGEYVNGKFYYGIKTGLNEAFVIDRQIRELLIAEDPKSEELIKPWLRGRDIKKWKAEWAGLYVIFTRRGTDIEKYSAIKKHLEQYRENLEPKKTSTQKKGRKPGPYKWFEIQDNIAYYKEFEKPKIIWGNLATEPKFAFDVSSNYISAPANIIPTGDVYLLAVLNSPLCRWWISSQAAVRAGGFLEYKPMYVGTVPVFSASDKQKAPIIDLVNKILAAMQCRDAKSCVSTKSTQSNHTDAKSCVSTKSTQSNHTDAKSCVSTKSTQSNHTDAKSCVSTSDIDALEKEIDQLVYKLYGLTPDEIAIVERKG